MFFHTYYYIEIRLTKQIKTLRKYMFLLTGYHTYYLEIDNGYDFMSVEHEAFDRAYLENDFSEDNPKEPQTQYHAALRKRWFIEYFNQNLFLGFQLKNINSFEFTID